MLNFEKYIDSVFENDFFKIFWNSLTDGVRITDQEGNVLYANNAYCSLIDKSREEVLGIPYTDLYHPKIRSEILNMYQRNFRLDQMNTHFQRELILWNGRKVWYEFFNYPVDIEGVEKVVLCVVKNITSQKREEIEHSKTAARLRSLAAHQQTVREEERTMIAREIHDELGQVLTVLKIQNSLVGKKLAPDQKDLKEKIQRAETMIDAAVDSVQKICSKLRPGVLDNLGLVAAIEWQCMEFEKSTNIETHCTTFKGELTLPPQKVTAIYRIFQEALTNVARHSGATKVEVDFIVQGNNLSLEVRDNGSGISDSRIEGRTSHGLIGMKERALLFSGEVEILGEAGKGTTVKVRIPKKDNRELL